MVVLLSDFACSISYILHLFNISHFAFSPCENPKIARLFGFASHHAMFIELNRPQKLVYVNYGFIK
jgi:hypothetical protein